MGSVTHADGSLSLVDNDSATCSPQIPSENDGSLDLQLPDSILMVPSPPEPVYGNGNLELIPQPVNEYEEDSLQANLDIMYLETFGNMAHASELAEIAQIEDELKLQQQMEVENEFKQAEEHLQNGVELHQMAFTFETENDGLVNEGRDLFEDMNIHHTSQQPPIQTQVKLPSPSPAETEISIEGFPDPDTLESDEIPCEETEEEEEEETKVEEVEETKVEEVEETKAEEVEEIKAEEEEETKAEEEEETKAEGEEETKAEEVEETKEETEIVEKSNLVQNESIRDPNEETDKIIDELGPVECGRSEPIHESIEMEEPLGDLKQDLVKSEDNSEAEMDIENIETEVVEKLKMPETQECYVKLTEHKMPIVAETVFSDDSEEEPSNDNDNSGRVLIDIDSMKKILQSRKLNKPFKVPVVPAFIHDGLDEDDELLRAFKARQDESMTHICVLCYKWFEDQTALSTHMKEKHRTNTQLEKCRFCSKTFIARFLRLRHEKNHKYDTKYPFDLYYPPVHLPFDYYVPHHFYKRFKSAPFTTEYSSKIKDIKNSVSKLPFECCDCGKDFKGEEPLREHYERFHAVQLCGICKEKFVNLESLRRHEWKVHDYCPMDENYEGGAWNVWKHWEMEQIEEMKTNISNIEFMHTYAYKEEEVDEIDTATIIEKTIEKQLKVKSNFKRPLSVKGEDSLLNSPKRARQTLNQNSVLMTDQIDSIKTEDLLQPTFIEPSHSESSITTTTTSSTCEMCNQVFPSTDEMILHVQKHHSGERPYKCQFCGRGFATHSNRKEHERIHTGERPYVCIYCSRGFVQISNLKKHMQTHKDKNNLQCKICLKQFVKDSSLLLHQRAHAVDRKFKCKHCDKAYNYSSLLKRHERIHTGEMPYSCDICSMPFHELVSLTYHRKKVHTGERPHKCQTCSRAFILSSDLKKHLKVHLKTAKEEAEVSDGSDSDSINSLLRREMSENGSNNSNSGSNDATPTGKGFRTYANIGKTPTHRKSANHSESGNKKQKESSTTAAVGSFGDVSKVKSENKDSSVEVYDIYEDDHDETGIKVVESGRKSQTKLFNKNKNKDPNSGGDTRVMWVENGDDVEGKFIVVDDDGNEIDGESIQLCEIYDDQQ